MKQAKTISISKFFLVFLILVTVCPLEARAYVSPNNLNDYYTGYQDHLNEINIGYAWSYTTGSPNVVVAVIDDGIYLNHLDLRDNIWENKKEITGNQIDDDDNSYIDDFFGWNFIDNSPEMTVKGKHGTMVAGIISAEGNNGIGITGIAWNIKLMSLIACDSDSCPTESVVEAIRYATDNGADVINLSLGQNGTYSYLYEPFDDVINYAYSKGVIIVASAGNGDIEGGIGKDLERFPVSPVCNEAEDQIIGVAATGEQINQLAYWSNYGGCAQVSAPGLDIISTSPFNYSDFDVEYDIGSGTSFSAPIISGIAALLRSYNRLITNSEVIKIINESVKFGTANTSRKIDAQNIFNSSGKSIDLLSVEKDKVNPGDKLRISANNFNSNIGVVKLIGPLTITLESDEVKYLSNRQFEIKIPNHGIASGIYTIDVNGVKLYNAFEIIELAYNLQDTHPYSGSSSNPLNLHVNWLIKNKEFVEIFYVDENLCLHWIINEQAAEKHFGVTWNYEGNIKEFDEVPGEYYNFCDNLD